MGTFNISITGVGGHGCDRKAKEGEALTRCQAANCPDCLAAQLVDDLKSRGNSVSEATLTHWPGQPTEVQDDLLNGKRKRGAF